MFIDRPLATLSADHAERFVRSMFAPDQQFARAALAWFRAAGHNHPTARLEARIALHHASRRVLDDLGDPDLHTVGFQQVAAHWQDAGAAATFQPIGMFGYRALADHELGDELAARLEVSANSVGIAHDLGILDGHGREPILSAILRSIAHRAERAGHLQRLLVVDDSLREPCARFGIEFPAALQLAARRHAIGIFELEAVRARLAADRPAAAPTDLAWAA